MTKKIVHGFGILAGAFLTVYALFALLFYHYVNAGNLGILASGLVLLCYTLFYHRVPRRMRLLLNSLGGICMVLALFLTIWMLWAAYGNQPDPQNPPGTVVVLGAKIVGDQPSVLLGHRLNEAVHYLQQYPHATVVVAGGLGADASYTEAHVMSLYLQKQGIPQQRILEEGSSTNTRENLQNSANLIRTHGLDSRVVICTDSFHQLRAAMYAKMAGLHAYAASSPTPMGLIPMYYMREWFGIAKLALVGQ